MTTYSGVNMSVYYVTVKRQPQTFFQTESRTTEAREGCSSIFIYQLIWKLKKKKEKKLRNYLTLERKTIIKNISMCFQFRIFILNLNSQQISITLCRQWTIKYSIHLTRCSCINQKCRGIYRNFLWISKNNIILLFVL